MLRASAPTLLAHGTTAPEEDHCTGRALESRGSGDVRGHLNSVALRRHRCLRE